MGDLIGEEDWPGWWQMLSRTVDEKSCRYTDGRSGFTKKKERL